MSTFLNQVNVGDRPLAANQNVIIDTVNAVQAASGSNGINVSFENGSLSIIGPATRAFTLPVAKTIARNDVGADLSPGDIACLDADAMVEVDPYTVSEPLPAVLKEPEDGDVGNWVVVLEAIPDGGSGSVGTAGLALAKVRRTSDNSTVVLRYAEFVPGESYLYASPIGSGRIIWEQTQDVEGADLTLTDDHFALIAFGYASPPAFAEATSDPASGTLTVKLAKSEGTLVGDDITVYDGGIT